MSKRAIQQVLMRALGDLEFRASLRTDADLALRDYELTDEERRALTEPDVGLLYVLGVNGQLLMHFAALHKFEWNAYLDAMRQGLVKHGPVREGVYAATGYEGVDAHDARLKREREKH